MRVRNILALLVCTVALAAKPASVSKLRSAGEVAFSKGELDQVRSPPNSVHNAASSTDVLLRA